MTVFTGIVRVTGSIEPRKMHTEQNGNTDSSHTGFLQALQYLSPSLNTYRLSEVVMLKLPVGVNMGVNALVYLYCTYQPVNVDLAEHATLNSIYIFL